MPFFLTLAVASAVGFLFLKGKVPGGVMVGALVGTVALNIGTDLAYMPAVARTVAQITAGAFIGASIRRDDVRRMPKLVKPAVILLTCLYCWLPAAGQGQQNPQAQGQNRPEPPHSS